MESHGAQLPSRIRCDVVLLRPLSFGDSLTGDLVWTPRDPERFCVVGLMWRPDDANVLTRRFVDFAAARVGA